MKATEIREKSVEELNKLLAEKEQGQFNLKMQKSLGQIENFSQIAEVRKDIARIKTILTEKAHDEKRGES